MLLLTVFFFHVSIQLNSFLLTTYYSNTLHKNVMYKSVECYKNFSDLHRSEQKQKTLYKVDKDVFVLAWRDGRVVRRAACCDASALPVGPAPPPAGPVSCRGRRPARPPSFDRGSSPSARCRIPCSRNLNTTIASFVVVGLFFKQYYIFLSIEF